MVGRGEEPTLRESLTAVAKRPRPAFFMRADDADDRTYHALSDVIRVIAGDEAWSRSSSKTFEAVLLKAIGQLDDTFPEGRAGYSGKPKRAVALVLYGFADNKITPRPGHDREEYKYKEDYYREACQLIGGSLIDRTYGRAFEQIRDDIAGILIKLAQHAVAEREKIAAQLPLTVPQLVYRHDQVEIIRSWIDEGHPIIAIWGEPGIGKTILAQQVGQKLYENAVITLRLGNDKLLQDDVVDALIREGLEPSTWNESYCRAMLRRMLADQPRSRLVIVDNLEDENEFRQLIPPNAKLPIIVTARREPQLDGISGELHDFSEVQATSFIREHISHASENDAATLARVLGCRPLAIDLAIRYLKDCPEVSLPDLLESFTTSVSAGIDLVTPLVGNTDNLVHLYEMILGSITRNASARHVLNCFLGIAGKSAVTPRSLVRAYAASEYSAIKSDFTLDNVQFNAGVRTLRAYGLMREEGIYLAMHRLTYEIMCELNGRKLPHALKFVVFLLRDRSIPAERPDEGDLYEFAWELREEIKATLHLHPAWLVTYCVDRATWIFIRRTVYEDGRNVFLILRMELTPLGFYLTDLLSGKRWRASMPEARELDALAQMYDKRVHEKVYPSKAQELGKGGEVSEGLSDDS